MTDVKLYKDDKTATVILEVGRETRSLTMGEWSRLIALPMKARDHFDFSRKDGGAA
jgi:hypothetical protein